MKEKITVKDKQMLAHLVPYGEFADIYLCFIYYKNKDKYMDSVFNKVKMWVEENGGRMEKIQGKTAPSFDNPTFGKNKKYIQRDYDKIIDGERKGYKVKIVFPTFNNRDMKNIMSTIYH